MRNFLNNILNYIGAASLTDLEFDSVTAEVAALSQATYDDLARILSERESVSDAQDRLILFYRAGGVEVAEISTAKTNVFMGAVLD